MSVAAAKILPPPPVVRAAAYFLDIDGTLLDIARTPEEVQTGRRELELIKELHRACDGALALVSGRSLAMIDELFAPLRLPAAGQHGIERRDARGRVQRPAYPLERLQRAAGAMRDFAARHEGLVFENKGYTFSLHYRLAPELAEQAQAVVRDTAAALGDWVEVLVGKRVAELKPAGRNKGVAIEEFLREPPFAGRTAVFLGDDITDEDGFRAVNRLGGHAIKIGPGATAARWRLADPHAAREWLRRCAAATS
jgi:trehalose 6-phosphate phosphatase